MNKFAALVLMCLGLNSPSSLAGILETGAAGSVRQLAVYPNGYVARNAAVLGDGKLFAYGASGRHLLLPGSAEDLFKARRTRAGNVLHAEPLVWDPARRAWERLPMPPECDAQRTLPTLTALPNNKVLVAGGLCDRARMGDDDSPYPPFTAMSLWNGSSRAWEAAPSLSAMRILHSATALPDGAVLLAGGEGDPAAGVTGKRVLASVERYSGSAVTQVAPMLTARARHSATLQRSGGVIVAGGIGPDGKPTAAVEILDKDGTRWRALAPMHAARAGHSAILLADGSVLVAGGTTSKGALFTRAMLWRPEGGRWLAAGKLPAEAPYVDSNSLAMTAHPGGGVLMLGAMRVTHWAPSRRVADGTPAHGERVLHAATLLADGRIMLSGGLSGSPHGGFASDKLDAVDFYDPATAAFTQGTRMVQPRVMHATLQLDHGRILVAGGWSGDRARYGEPAGNSPEVWDPRDGRWQQLARVNFAANDWVHMRRLADGKVMFFASNEAEQALPYRAWTWDPASNEVYEKKVSLPAHHEAAIGILADGRVLRLGGRAAKGAPESPAAQIWDSRDGSVRTIAAPGSWQAPNGKTLVRRNGKLLFIDHRPAKLYNDLTQTAPIVEWDPETEKWSALPSLPAHQNWPLLELANGHLRTREHSLAPGLMGWKDAPKADSGSDLLQLASGELLAISTRPPYARKLDAITGDWEFLTPRNEAPAWQSPPAMVALPDGRVLVAARLSTAQADPPLAHVWDPKNNSWTFAGRLRQAAWRYPQALRLPSGKVMHISVDNNNTLVCELWSGAAKDWDPCAGQGVMASFASPPALGLLPDGRAVLVTHTATAWAYDAATAAWTQLQTEWHSESIVFGAPIRSTQALLRVRDSTSAPWIDIDDTAGRYYESAQDQVRMLWEPKEKRWAYVFRGTMGPQAQWLPDGCAYAWRGSTLFDAASGSARAVPQPAMGIDDIGKSMLVLADGTAVFAGLSDGAEREDAGFYHRKISCAGFAAHADDAAMMPGMSIGAGAAPAATVTPAGPAGKGTLARYAPPAALVLLVMLMAGAGVWLWRRADSARTRMLSVGALALLALAGGLAALLSQRAPARPADPGVTAWYHRAGGVVGLSRLPCSMVGVWSSRQRPGQMYRVTLFPDGTYKQEPNAEVSGPTNKGEWTVRGDKLVWTHSAYADLDINPIVPKSATAFTLVEMNGSRTEFDLIRPIASTTCSS